VIDPGEAAAKELLALVHQSGVSEVVEFGGGQLVLVGATIPRTSRLIGWPLAELRANRDDWDWVVAALVRHGETTVAHGDTVIEPGDHVLVMVGADDVERATELLGVRHRPVRRVVILGSTRLAELTARLMLEDGYEVIVVDEEAARCRKIAERLAKALVINDDPTDPDTLASLNLDDRDTVLALTGWDHVNVLGCLVAKALGAATAVARFNRIAYVNLLAGTGIDAAVSSRLIAAGAILRFVRRGRIHSVVTFNDTDAEAIELEVDPRSEAVGRPLSDVGLPRGAVVGGILRRDEAFVPTGTTEIQPHDHVIVFSMPDCIDEVEQLFGRE
jgi:trk system potassium uptake protein